MKVNILKMALLGCCLWGVSACEVINPAEGIPAYVYIDELTLENNPLVNHGSLSHKVTNAYVFIGGTFMGVFNLPALVPVYGEGEQELILDPTIRQNGLLGSLAVYPFYERVTTSVNLSPGQTDTIQPVSRYKDDIRFHFVENFDFGGNIFNEDLDGDDDSFVDFTTTEEAFEGQRSGLVVLTEDHPFIEVATSPGELYDLRDGGRVYLEVNYKTEAQLLFGLIGVGPGGAIPNYEYGLVGKEEWNKVYFELTDLISVSGFDNYQIGFTAGLPVENGAFTLDTARIYLDNIKLVSF